MNHTIIALSAYILWTCILLFAIAGFRTYYNKANKRQSLRFDPSGSDVGGFGERLTRAHANCIESFVFVGGSMLLALATSSAVITNTLALFVLGARVLQSCVHMASSSGMAISIRFVLFLIQVIICMYWNIQILVKFT